MVAVGCTPEVDGVDPAGGEAIAEGAGSGPDLRWDAQPLLTLPREDVRRIRTAFGNARNECLSQRGFDQLSEIRVPDDARTSLDYVGWSPYTFGATSVEEAAERGLDPLLIPQPTPFPTVISSNPAFEEAVEECDAISWNALGELAKETMDSVERLGQYLHNAFVERALASARYLRLHEARLSCLANRGFRSTSGPSVFARPAGPWFGIGFGEVVYTFPGGAPDAPAHEAVTIAQPPTRTYRPTTEEVSFAIADVECRHEIDFDCGGFELAIDIQSDLLEEVSSTIQDVIHDLAEVIEEAEQ